MLFLITTKELSFKLQNVLGKGVIRPNVSPWSTPIILVKKKDGTCMCIDYMEVN